MNSEKKIIITKKTIIKKDKKIQINHNDYKEGFVSLYNNLPQDLFQKSTEHFVLPAGMYQIQFTLPFNTPKTLQQYTALRGYLLIKKNSENIQKVPINCALMTHFDSFTAGLFTFTTNIFQVEENDKIYFEFDMESLNVLSTDQVTFEDSTVQIRTI